MEFFTQHKFQAKRGSKVWNRIGISWRSLVREVVPVLPILKEELMIESFWWSPSSPQIGAGFSKARAAKIHKAGLVQIRDAHTEDRFLTAIEAQAKFGILPGEFGV
jgi:hypothetical protein